MRFVLLLAFVSFVAASVGQADAKERIPLGEDKFKISGGGFLTDFNSGLRVDRNIDDENKEINVEDDLGLNSSASSFRIDGYWRVGPRHRIVSGYYSLGRSSDHVLEREVEWEDGVFPVGAMVGSGLKLGVTPISYAYSFIKREQWEVAASVGVHWTKVSAFIGGEAFVDGEPVLSEFHEESDIKGPFPLVGLLVDFSPSPKWQIGTSLQYLDISISKYNGRLLDLRLYAEYYIWRNVGIGISYNYFDLNAGVTQEEYTGNVKLKFDGFLGYLTAKF
jgi:hypothetical protein